MLRFKRVKSVTYIGKEFIVRVCVSVLCFMKEKGELVMRKETER